MVVLSFSHFWHENSLYTVACFCHLLNLIKFFHFFEHFLTTPKTSLFMFDPLLGVHSHALFICNFTSPCHMFGCLLISNCAYFISICWFSMLFKKW